MFVFLSKFLPPLVYPLGLAMIVLALVLILTRFFRRHPRLQTTLILIAFLLLLVGSNRWAAYWLQRSLEWQYLPPNPVPQAEAIVVLGGGTEGMEYPRPIVEVNSAGDRVLYAAKLYKEGKAPVILLSGGQITWLNKTPSTPAEEMASILEQMDVPQSALWLQPRSENTHDDAEYSAQMLKDKGVKRVLLVTSAMHMPRSVALFRHLGVDVIPAPVDYGTTDEGLASIDSLDPQSLLVNITPNVSSLSATTNALKEYLGLLVYHLKGWL
jgi:uncharacterized SAM-binding protein YcdF (DUF218 family)